MPAREGHDTRKAVGDGSHEAGHGGSAEQWGRVQSCRAEKHHEEPGPGSGPAHPSLGLWRTLTRGRGDGCGRQPIKADGADLLDVAG